MKSIQFFSASKSWKKPLGLSNDFSIFIKTLEHLCTKYAAKPGLATQQLKDIRQISDIDDKHNNLYIQ